MSSKQKIAFFGSDEIALPCLQALVDSSSNYEICGVLTQPDRRSGRGRKLQPNSIKRWAMASEIPVMTPDKPGGGKWNGLKHRSRSDSGDGIWSYFERGSFNGRPVWMF